MALRSSSRKRSFSLLFFIASAIFATNHCNTNKLGYQRQYGNLFVTGLVTPTTKSSPVTTTGGTLATIEALNTKVVPFTFRGHSVYAEVTKVDRADEPTANGVLRGFFRSTGMVDDRATNKKKPISVVLIHGFGCSTYYWRETVRACVNAGYTCHAIDLLGQGKSSKPDRDNDGIVYSIELWASLVDAYVKEHIPSNESIVLMGNSLGSVVALSAACGDFVNNDKNSGSGLSDNTNSDRNTVVDQTEAFGTVAEATIPNRCVGIGLYNCGVGMNSQNLLRDPKLNPLERTIFTAIFSILNALIFNNKALLTYVLNDVVTKDVIRNALIALYACAKPNPESRVDDSLVDSFFYPAKDTGSPQALSQIYVNDAGPTPMELHEKYPQLGLLSKKLPIHLVWGTKDNVTPITGSVGQFYTKLAEVTAASAQDHNDTDHCSDLQVTMDIIEAGHVPFDEVPECNDSMLRWVDDVVLPLASATKTSTQRGDASTKGSFNTFPSWEALQTQFPFARK